MEKLKEEDLYPIKEIEKQTVENHVKNALSDMYQFDGIMNPDELEIFALDIAGVSKRSIGKRLGLTRQIVDARLYRAKQAVAMAKPESPIAQGREGVQQLIPKGVKAYEKSLDEYIDNDKRPGLAIKTATEVLKGTQVLIPKEERETVKETVETKRMIMIERLEIATQFGAQAPENEQLEANKGLIEASDGQQAPTEGLKSSPERPDPTPGEADQGGADVQEIGASKSDHQN